MTRAAALLALVSLAAACAPAARQFACGEREVVLRNASAVAVEQARAGSGTPGGWGAELLGPASLPPGASRTLRLPGGTQAVRLVWADGRAVELGNLDACAIRALVLSDAALQAER